MRPCPQWRYLSALAEATEVTAKPHISANAIRVSIQHSDQTTTLVMCHTAVELCELQGRTDGKYAASKAHTLEPRETARLTTNADPTHLVSDRFCRGGRRLPLGDYALDFLVRL